MTAVFRNKKLYITEENKFTDVAWSKIIYSAYQNYCGENDIEGELSLEDIVRWLDKKVKDVDGLKEVSALIDMFSQSKDMKDLIEEQEKKSLTAESQNALTSIESIPISRAS